MIGIAEIAEGERLIEDCGPSRRPRWITPGGRPLGTPGRNRLLDWETMPHVMLRSWRLRDVVLDGTTMLLLHQGSVIGESNYHRAPQELEAVRSHAGPVIDVEDDVPALICGDAWSSNHYHFLNHTLPAIDAVAGEAGRRLLLHQLRPVHARMLSVLGHDRHPTTTLQPGHQYRIRRAEFCNLTVGIADFACSATIQAPHDRLAGAVPDDGVHAGRLYVSRLDDPHRRMAGEAELVDGLRRRGFTIASPAQTTLEEQVALFRRARFVVGPHGAGLANVSFCRPGTAVYDLLPEHFVEPSILTLAIRRDAPAWVDAFPGAAAPTSHTLDWVLDVPAALARVDEIAPD